MIEIAEVRKRVKVAIAAARRAATDRREQVAAARSDYDRFLERMAVPVFRMVASSLTGEGHAVTIATPADRVQLRSAHTPSDAIEIVLDTSVHPPVALGRTMHTRGKTTHTSERPVRPDTPVGTLTHEDVLEFVLAEIGIFVAR